MTLHFSLAFEEIAKSPGSRLARLVYNVYTIIQRTFFPDLKGIKLGKAVSVY